MVSSFRDIYIRVSGGIFFVVGALLLALPVLYWMTGLMQLLGYEFIYGVYDAWFGWENQVLTVVTTLFVTSLLMATGYGLSEQKPWGDWLGIVLCGLILLLALVRVTYFIVGGVFGLAGFFRALWVFFLFVALYHRRRYGRSETKNLKEGEI